MTKPPSPRPLSVIILALVLIAYGIVCFYVWTPILPEHFGDLFGLFFALFAFGYRVLDGPMFCIIGLGLLGLKKWAWRLAIGYASVMLLASLPSVVGYLLRPVSLEPGNFFAWHDPPGRIGYTHPYYTAIAMIYVPPLVYLCTLLVLIKRKAAFGKRGA